MIAVRKRALQKLVALIVIAAMLDLVGLSPPIIIFFFVAGCLVWLVILRSNRRDAREVFEFYLAADEILRDEERHWYGFEISEVVDRGERVLVSMPDPPPLLYYSLGALQHRVGDYQAAIENLAELLETGLTEEHQRTSPSPALRHYVQLLRNIEREPAIAPMALAAVRSLERGRRNRAPYLLADSRERLQKAALENDHSAAGSFADLSARDLCSDSTIVNAPRPISEVLHDVYQEETTALSDSV